MTARRTVRLRKRVTISPGRASDNRAHTDRLQGYREEGHVVVEDRIQRLPINRDIHGDHGRTEEDQWFGSGRGVLCIGRFYGHSGSVGLRDLAHWLGSKLLPIRRGLLRDTLNERFWDQRGQIRPAGTAFTVATVRIVSHSEVGPSETVLLDRRRSSGVFQAGRVSGVLETECRYPALATTRRGWQRLELPRNPFLQIHSVLAFLLGSQILSFH